MFKTERLTIKVLQSDKAALERLAKAEGEPVSVIVRRLIRQTVRNETSPSHSVGKTYREGAEHA